MESSRKLAEKIGVFSIVVNLVMACLKWTVGYFGHSFALIADAIESTADIFSSLLMLLGLKYANRPADENHPYGHGRMEPLVTFLVVSFLVSSALYIAHTSWNNIWTPHKGPEAYTFWVLLAVIAIKEVVFRIISRKSKDLKSTALQADAWHHRSDAITSFAALIGILIALMLGNGYEAADDWAALLASGIILYNSYLIFRPALGEIMDEHKYHELVEEIRRIAHEIPAVRNTEKCFVRKSGMHFYVDLHIRVDGQMSVWSSHQVSHDVKDHLMEQLPHLANVLIHVEPDRPTLEAEQSRGRESSAE